MSAKLKSQEAAFRLVGLAIVVGSLLWTVSLLPSSYIIPNQLSEYYVENRKCEPGVFRQPSQLQHSRWYPFGNVSLSFPVYVTQPLNATDHFIEQAIIVQHGNNRDANCYFCGAVNSLLETNSSLDSLRTHLIISPQFLVDGDLCWDATTFSMRTVNVSANSTCDYPVWTSEGWKDGQSPINARQLPSLAHFPYQPLFSYDVFNLLIDHLANKTLFPRLKLITLFGFSAGGQTVLRYSMWPQMHRKHSPTSDSLVHNASTSVQYVVADISSYLYFDARRAFVNGSKGYGIPTPDWLDSTPWKVDGQGKPWITSWNTSCAGFNLWRFGLEQLQGYYEYHANQSPNFREELIAAFPGRDLHLLIGLNDSLNCKLPGAGEGCQDNDLATYCPAMLQGANRLDRFLKWRDYLEAFYHLNNTIDYTFVKNIAHDAVAMLRSDAAKCVVFKYCEAMQSVADFQLGPARLRWT